MHQSYLVMRAVSNLRLGLQQSSCGIGGPLSLSVLQKQVGTQLLPFYFSSAADIYLDMKNVRVKSAIRHCCLLIGQSLQTSNRLTGCCFINFFLNRGLQYNLHPVLSRLMKKNFITFYLIKESLAPRVLNIWADDRLQNIPKLLKRQSTFFTCTSIASLQLVFLCLKSSLWTGKSISQKL